MPVFIIRCFGYAAAVISAVMVTLFFPVVPELVKWHDPKGLLALLVLGLAITGVGALPGFVVAVYVQSVRKIQSPYYWIVAGIFAALIANFLFAIVFIPITEFLVINTSLIGGAAGGFVYSLFHRRIAYLRGDLDVILRS